MELLDAVAATGGATEDRGRDRHVRGWTGLVVDLHLNHQLVGFMSCLCMVRRGNMYVLSLSLLASPGPSHGPPPGG